MRNIVLFGLALLMVGCKGYQYVPNPQYIPLNEKKGELIAGVSTNSIQLGYSFADHFSWFTSACLRPKAFSNNINNMLNDQVVTEKSHNIDVGFSFFSKTKYFNYEILMGAGFGHLDYSNDYKNADESGQENYKFEMDNGKYNFFVQPDIGIKVEDHFEIGLFSKFSMVNYYDINTSIEKSEIRKIDPHDEYFIRKENTSFFCTEPGLFVRAGGKHIKFNAVFAMNYFLTDAHINYRPGSFYLSLFLNFDLLKQKSETSK
jgi:hypothetical protein